MRVFTFCLAWLVPFSCLAHEVEISYSGVDIVEARIVSDYVAHDNCERYLAGAVVQMPRVTPANRIRLESGSRQIFLTSGIRKLSQACAPLSEARTVRLSTATFYLYAVKGEVNAVFSLPEGSQVEVVRVFPLED